MTVKEIIDLIEKYQTELDYTFVNGYYISGSCDYEIKDSFDAEIVFSCHSAYSFGVFVNTQNHYEVYFRFNGDLNTFQVSLTSKHNRDFVYLLLMKLQLRKVFIRTIVGYWTNVNLNLFYAFREYAKKAIEYNLPDVLHDILYTDWESLVSECNASSLCDSILVKNTVADHLDLVESKDHREPCFAINQVYNYSKNPVNVYDEGFIVPMSKYMDKLIDLSTSRSHAECTMILLRWKKDMFEKSGESINFEL